MPSLEQPEETTVDPFRISRHLGGTAWQEAMSLEEISSSLRTEFGKTRPEKKKNWGVHLGKKNAGIKINGDTDMDLISVAIMRSKNLAVSYHVIYDAEKVRFSTNLVLRGEKKQLVKDVTFINEKGGITITKEGKKYYVLSFINKTAKEQPSTA